VAPARRALARGGSGRRSAPRDGAGGPLRCPRVLSGSWRGARAPRRPGATRPRAWTAPPARGSRPRRRPLPRSIPSLSRFLGPVARFVGKRPVGSGGDDLDNTDPQRAKRPDVGP